jgi:Tfp pilus assembly protein PilF
LEPNEVPQALEHLGIAMIDAHLNHDDTANVLTESLRMRQPAERAWAALPIGHHAYEAAQHTVAVGVLDLALKTATRRKQAGTIRQIRNDLALSLIDTHSYRRAATLLNQNLSEAEDDGDSLTRSLALHSLAELNRRTDNPEAAEEYARRALETAKQMGDKDRETGALLQIGMAQSDQGKYKQATRTLNRVLKLAQPGTKDHGGALHSLAGISLGTGDPARAAELYREALKTEKKTVLPHCIRSTVQSPTPRPSSDTPRPWQRPATAAHTAGPCRSWSTRCAWSRSSSTTPSG